ncbi:Atrial natriuretic peptide receptor 1 [Hypsibius exemplaris]|uniref:Guanylate cyclase n=1 Tax=Hypsibius exemplaris TaxID=2072580 RepID=A0A1W0WZZ0_HYPEX|nr:Atrial natriuretic peptide receptor 1 [Hypsibius exemplaris]
METAARTAAREQAQTAPPQPAARAAAVRCGLRCGLQGSTINIQEAMHDTFESSFNCKDLRYPCNITYSAFRYNTFLPDYLQRIKQSLQTISTKTADELGMTNGEYVFIMMSLENNGLSTNGVVDNNWIITPFNDKFGIPFQVYPAKAALILNFVLSYTDQSVKAVKESVLNISRDYFHFPVPNNKLSTYFYPYFESHLIFGQILNQSYTETGKILRGAELAKWFVNHTFDLPTGELAIGESGERKCDILGSLINSTGQLVTVLKYTYHDGQLRDVVPANPYWPGGQWPPPNEPFCGFLHNNPKCSDTSQKKVLAGAVVGSLLFLILSIGTVVAWMWHQSVLMNASWWQMNLDMTEPDTGSMSSRLSLLRRGDADTASIIARKHTCILRLRTGLIVWKSPIRALDADGHFRITSDLANLLSHVKNIHHVNVNNFVGILTDTVPACILEEYCPRGSLDDLLEGLHLDMDMTFSLMIDFIQGLVYLHDSPLKLHGNLKSSKCLLDNRFGLKISDFANHKLMRIFNSASFRRKSSSRTLDLRAGYDNYFWTAPEVLRGSLPDAESDIYSFAIIVYQILAARSDPYDNDQFSAQEREILQTTCGHRATYAEFVPTHFAHELTQVHKIISDGWAEDPAARPGAHSVRKALDQAMLTVGLDGSRSLFDALWVSAEVYCLKNLEELLEQRTEQADGRTWTLLNMISGEMLAQKYFEQATVFFSDLVGFIDFVDRSSPITVLEFLHLVYSRFDDILTNYDVYKVETIGDSYMVASGLPIRNGQEHIREICRMALALQKIFPRLYSSNDGDDQKLSLRIGIHTGPVAAGVVGQKTPRYCLFGDTVNTSSRMESHGLPGRIHCSEPVAALAESLGFLMKPRGEIRIKGKGDVLTFWLEREVGRRSVEDVACGTSVQA